MSNVFTLDALREETIRRYAPTIVDVGDGNTVELTSILRLRDKDRKAVIEAIEEINEIEYDEDEEDLAEWSELVVESCAKVFKLVCDSPKKLLARLEHDDPQIRANLHTAVLARWVGETQLGEAESSPN